MFTLLLDVIQKSFCFSYPKSMSLSYCRRLLSCFHLRLTNIISKTCAPAERASEADPQASDERYRRGSAVVTAIAPPYQEAVNLVCCVATSLPYWMHTCSYRATKTFPKVHFFTKKIQKVTIPFTEPSPRFSCDDFFSQRL